MLSKCPDVRRGHLHREGSPAQESQGTSSGFQIAVSFQFESCLAFLRLVARRRGICGRLRRLLVPFGLHSSSATRLPSFKTAG